jgi:hypothetical protein
MNRRQRRLIEKNDSKFKRMMIEELKKERLKLERMSPEQMEKYKLDNNIQTKPIEQPLDLSSLTLEPLTLGI